MSQKGQTHFKNLVANAARFLKCVWPFWDIMHERVKYAKNSNQNKAYVNIQKNYLSVRSVDLCSL